MDFSEIQGSSVTRAAALHIVDLLRYRLFAYLSATNNGEAGGSTPASAMRPRVRYAFG
jgi:hypothetical protein